MVKNLKFEDALKRLEEIVEKLESGKFDLEKSLGLFEEGIKLARICTSKLEEAKRKVEILVKKGDKIIPEPFEKASDNSKDDEESLE